MNLSKENFSKGFWEFLRVSRISQDKIAEACDVSASVVSSWKTGRGLPTYESLQALYNLGMSSNLMFGNVGGRDVELWSLFGLDKAEKLNVSDHGETLARWDAVLRDPDKTTAQKVYFFFMQASTFRDILNDIQLKKVFDGCQLNYIKKNND